MGMEVSWWLSMPITLTVLWGDVPLWGMILTSLPAIPPFAPLSTNEALCDCLCSETLYIQCILTFLYFVPLNSISSLLFLKVSLWLVANTCLISAGDMLFAVDDAALIRIVLSGVSSSAVSPWSSCCWFSWRHEIKSMADMSWSMERRGAVLFVLGLSPKMVALASWDRVFQIFLWSTLRLFHFSFGSLVFGILLLEDLVILAWIVEISVSML